jgi:hypothetical protein
MPASELEPPDPPVPVVDPPDPPDELVVTLVLAPAEPPLPVDAVALVVELSSPPQLAAAIAAKRNIGPRTALE